MATNLQLRQHQALVKRCASMVLAKVPSNIERADLEQVGMLGLAEALDRFDPGQGVQIETFAWTRIYGAMLDELRRCDPLPRPLRRFEKASQTASALLSNRLGRQPLESEVAAHLGVTLTELRTESWRAWSMAQVYADDLVHEDSDPADDADPADLLAHAQEEAALSAAIESLPERLRQVVAWAYEDGKSDLEIGVLLGRSSARALQLRAAAIEKIRVRFRAALRK